MTHDYSWAVLKRYSSKSLDAGAVLGASGHVTIKSNVFIGMNTIITRNVTIGENVIIGAGSIVTKDCLDNGVYAGNPAKRVMEIEEFYQKRKELQLQEAEILAHKYYERYGKMPPKEIFHEYFLLFSNLEQIQQSDIFNEKMCKCMNEQDSYEYVLHHRPQFSCFEEFMNHCFSNEKLRDSKDE